ncbi:unnamed protein product [Brassicogethes aeneus]|uniref:Uncharacterized protein n=1 Tax=Brassicogethes aeneus TaxID=1431903 RepID=A0A9P0BJS1_BRAAE|nr:unnamed protein product [Brassicogethes aeneus]
MSERIRSPTSAKVVAWLFIILFIVSIVYIIIQLIKNQAKGAITNIVGSAIEILFSSLILVGLKRNSRYCLLPWLILNGLLAVGCCIFAAYFLVTLNFLVFFVFAFITGYIIIGFFIVKSNFIRMGSVSRNPQAKV